MDITKVLPKDCISKIISFLTSPRDACRSSVVSPVFKELADSDATWEAILPSDCKSVVAQSSSPNLLQLPAKQLYLHLSDNPVLVAGGTMTFSLDKESGKKCYTVGARGLGIIWGDTPRYWKYTVTPASRFPQVAKLRTVWWLDVSGRLGTNLLSLGTSYAVLFVFKFGKRTFGFKDDPVELSVTCEGSPTVSHKRVILDPSAGDGTVRQRQDGWMEVEMGDFFNDFEDDVLVEFKLWEVNTNFAKKGLVIEGVEFRPKSIE